MHIIVQRRGLSLQSKFYAFRRQFADESIRGSTKFECIHLDTGRQCMVLYSMMQGQPQRLSRPVGHQSLPKKKKKSELVANYHIIRI